VAWLSQEVLETVYTQFVVIKAAMAQVCLQGLQFSFVGIVSSTLRTHLSLTLHNLSN
jgi:hypothetical protein